MLLFLGAYTFDVKYYNIAELNSIMNALTYEWEKSRTLSLYN